MILLRGLSVLVLGYVLAFTGVVVDMGSRWTPLERRYFPSYVGSIAFNGEGHYTFLFVLYPDGWRLASSDDVVQEVGAPGRPSRLGFVLSESARFGKAKKLEWRTYSRLDHATAYEQLSQRIYRGQTPWELVWWPMMPGIAFVTFMLPWTILRGRRAQREAKRGYILRGPTFVALWQFNRHKRSDGIGFQTFEPLTKWERLLRRRPKPCVVRIPRHEENSHFVLMGDSGTGKSSLIRQLLLQIRARGETAVVYDPALEFTPQFYDPAADVLLNPTDQRMPFWAPSDEVRYPAEALALAGSLFPDKPRENTFFTEAARKIFAHLLRYRPTPQDLTEWMKNMDEIDRRIARTELQAMMPRSAAGQRAAVQGTFNQAAAAFQLLPKESETIARWSAASWAQTRKGWLFLPSTPTQRDSLRPLISMWLDSLILRLMDFGQKGAPPVWFILDELASLQRLPQLPTVITESRKANVCLVLGFQGRSQLEGLYGPQAEVMLSQPMTKIFLRTSEPDAAQWVSRSIGEVEVSRLEVSHTQGLPRLLKGFQRSMTSHWQRRTEPLVMASTIAALHNLTGYLKSRDFVVPMSFPYSQPQAQHPGFLPRPLPELEPLTKPPDVPSTNDREPPPEPKAVAHDRAQEPTSSHTSEVEFEVFE